MHRTRVLVTCRHPGPAACVRTLVEALPHRDWLVAAAPPAAQMLTGLRGRPGVDLIEMDPSAKVSVAAARRLLEQVRPEVVIRTTPATGDGLDEVIAVAVAGSVPVLCVQDFPGLGQALGADAGAAPDLVLTVDDESASWLRHRTAAPAVGIGWLGLERLRTGPPPSFLRDRVRHLLGLSSPVLLVVGSSSDISVRDELAMLEEAADLPLRGQSPQMIYRVHPRRDAEEAKALHRVVSAPLPDGALDDLTEREVLSLPDAVVSMASMFNLEVLAVATQEPLCPAPVSVFYRPSSEWNMSGFWGQIGRAHV